MQSISVGDAKSRFSELISRAAAGERFLIERRERPMAVLISAPELDRLERASRMALRMALALGQDAELLHQIETQKIHPAMAAFGLWRDTEDLAQLADEIEAAREAGGSRPEVDL
ncbi:MAG TPA: type II toxin-antitoxin system prevent-host-death family antitoxin [Anaerolineae bacterium]